MGHYVAILFVSAWITLSSASAETFEIVVRRTEASTGKLYFLVDGEKKLETACWWRASDPIPSKTYTGCSTTIMATKGLKAVFLPNEQTGRNGIFIHAGSKPSHSEGCIVCSGEVVETIYDTVPRNMMQVTVKVIDP